MPGAVLRELHRSTEKKRGEEDRSQQPHYFGAQWVPALDAGGVDDNDQLGRRPSHPTGEARPAS